MSRGGRLEVCGSEPWTVFPAARSSHEAGDDEIVLVDQAWIRQGVSSERVDAAG